MRPCDRPLQICYRNVDGVCHSARDIDISRLATTLLFPMVHQCRIHLRTLSVSLPRSKAVLRHHNNNDIYCIDIRIANSTRNFDLLVYMNVKFHQFENNNSRLFDVVLNNIR